MATTEGGESVFEFGSGELDAELALENNSIFFRGVCSARRG